MKCPYLQRKHIEYKYNYKEPKLSEVEVQNQFEDCYKDDCPFYCYDARRTKKELCLRIGEG